MLREGKLCLETDNLQPNRSIARRAKKPELHWHGVHADYAKKGATRAGLREGVVVRVGRRRRLGRDDRAVGRVQRVQRREQAPRLRPRWHEALEQFGGAHADALVVALVNGVALVDRGALEGHAGKEAAREGVGEDRRGRRRLGGHGRLARGANRPRHRAELRAERDGAALGEGPAPWSSPPSRAVDAARFSPRRRTPPRHRSAASVLSTTKKSATCAPSWKPNDAPTVPMADGADQPPRGRRATTRPVPNRAEKAKPAFVTRKKACARIEQRVLSRSER